MPWHEDPSASNNCKGAMKGKIVYFVLLPPVKDLIRVCRHLEIWHRTVSSNVMLSEGEGLSRW